MKLFSQVGFKLVGWGFQILAGEEEFYVLRNIQTGSGALLASYFGGTPFRQGKVGVWIWPETLS